MAHRITFDTPTCAFETTLRKTSLAPCGVEHCFYWVQIALGHDLWHASMMGPCASATYISGLHPLCILSSDFHTTRYLAMSTKRVLPDGIYHIRFGENTAPGGMYATSGEEGQRITVQAQRPLPPPETQQVSAASQ